jgi:hypothetical protein
MKNFFIVKPPGFLVPGLNKKESLHYWQFKFSFNSKNPELIPRVVAKKESERLNWGKISSAGGVCY